MDEKVTLFDLEGSRLYLTPDEMDLFLSTAEKSSREIRTFCTILYYTGCRISEALELTPKRFDFANKTLIFETLKKRRKGVFRAVPVPFDVLDQLDMVHGIREALKAEKNGITEKPLWAWSRTTAWRRIKEVMDAGGIADGPQKAPKGIRHGFGVRAITKKVPINMVKKWMGHSNLTTTEIYLNAVGEEQHDINAQMWE
jgi:integrase/recombinase XerD